MLPPAKINPVATTDNNKPFFIVKLLVFFVYDASIA
jgi:hypothetical protein